MQSSLVCSFAPFSNDQGDRGRTSASLVPASTTSLTQASSSGKVIVKLTWAISILPNHGEKSAQTRGADRQSSRCSSAAGSPLHTMVNCDDRGLTTVVQMAWFHGTGGRLRIGMHRPLRRNPQVEVMSHFARQLVHFSYQLGASPVNCNTAATTTTMARDNGRNTFQPSRIS